MSDLKVILEILKVLIFGRKTPDDSREYVPTETRALVSEEKDEDG